MEYLDLSKILKYITNAYFFHPFYYELMASIRREVGLAGASVRTATKGCKGVIDTKCYTNDVKSKTI